MVCTGQYYNHLKFGDTDRLYNVQETFTNGRDEDVTHTYTHTRAHTHAYTHTHTHTRIHTHTYTHTHTHTHIHPHRHTHTQRPALGTNHVSQTVT